MPARFAASVVSFPNRGAGGDPKYRGNWGASFVEGMVSTYYPGRGIVVDPMQGSGTTRDVCKTLGIPYSGSDLKSGFDATTDDLLTRVRARTAEPITLITWHPPYAGMIVYSQDPRDLSAHGANIAAFDSMLNACTRNFAKALDDGGRLCVLTANWRKNGRYYRLSSLVENAGVEAGLVLEDETIKIQHNCASSETAYTGFGMPRIAHETLLVFRKIADVEQAEDAA